MSKSDADRSLNLISFGLFLLLIGAVYLNTPQIFSLVETFFRDLQLVRITDNLFLPAPTSNHPEFYGAIELFSFAYGITQGLLFILSFALNASLGKKSEFLSGVVFWIGVGYLFGLLSSRSVTWFLLLSGVIILLGLSIIMGALLRRRSGG